VVGLAATLGVLAFFYWLAPEWNGDKHASFFNALAWSAPVLLPLGLIYIAFVDAHMVQPEDGTWLAGALALGEKKWAALSAEERVLFKEHALAWCIKGFYLPQMFDMYVDAATGLARAPVGEIFNSSVTFGKVAVKAAVAVDMAFGALGYCATLRLFDGHIRSANPLAWGWTVTIMMYTPFWSVFYNNFFAYGDREDWHKLLPDNAALFWTWALLIALLRGGWAWANALYGYRFSNLTHRGIITAGPYRWTRHPSYLFKNLSWWITGLPFLGAASLDAALRACIAMLCMNGIYLLRAKAEERHLSEDPTYVAYALWVEHNSPLRFLRRIFPFIRYVPPPQAEAGLSKP
jgi:protein-S-isoprenylcysteine O-methyltransferase Ste14